MSLSLRDDGRPTPELSSSERPKKSEKQMGCFPLQLFEKADHDPQERGLGNRNLK